MARWIASITPFMWRVGSKANEKPVRPPPSSILKNSLGPLEKFLTGLSLA
jgi:hypothetical protein